MPIFMTLYFTLYLYTHSSYLLMFYFHESYSCFIDFECLMIMWFTCFSWNIILFYSFLEGFRTSLQVFHLTSCGILRYGRVFKHTLFSNLFLKTLSIQGRLVGRPCLVCSLLKIILKHVHEMGGKVLWDIHLILLLFNWYH